MFKMIRIHIFPGETRIETRIKDRVGFNRSVVPEMETQRGRGVIMMMGPDRRRLLLLWGREETSPKAPGRSLGGEAYLLGKNVGAQILQGDLESTSTIIVDYFGGNEHVGADRLSRLNWGGHDGLLLSQRCQVVREAVT